MSNPRFTEYRKDGWPLCPRCGEDEVYSMIALHYAGEGEPPTLEDCLKGDFGCYKCGWKYRRAKLRVTFRGKGTTALQNDTTDEAD